MTDILRNEGAGTHDSDGHSAALTPSDVSISRAPWQKFYARGVLLTDLAVLAITSVAAQVWRFGTSSSVTTHGPFHMSYTELSGVIVVMWWISLQLFQTRDPRILGDGPDEYARITRATVLMFGWLAIVSLMFKWDMSRGFLAIAFPLGLVGLLIGRKIWRVWLRGQRRHGRHLSNVLVVGGQRSAQDIALWLARHQESGLRVTGVWVPDSPGTERAWLDMPNEFIPIMGTDRTFAGAIEVAHANTVIVTDTEHLGPTGLRELTWQLEGVAIDLMVSPNVMDFSDARIHMRAVASMPLLHLEEPQYAGAGAWPKALFDRVFAVLVLVVASPLLLCAAVAVKLTSAGPVLFRQPRIGIDGSPFNVLKFRTMRVGADDELAGLIAAQGTSGTPLFKVKNDPRVTRIGTFLRRFSIDELPQLLNVIRGEMSLVGPRPQRAAEVELYDHHALRRLRVRPGMTGLWQVSGRSDLEWDDAIRLDTYYVENWSLMGDIVILWRTIRAVFASTGAY
ncbi:MAG: polyprenyl glycosylphosphotransferase [Aeromicrobium sp.]|nr:polyprenyl glycosylphosphotransferase [Aeromicrobium sp.]